MNELHDPYEMIERLPGKRRKIIWWVLGGLTVAMWIAILAGMILLF